MTDITDEQRAAWLRLSNDPSVKDMMHKPGATVESDAALIAPLLPFELTNPQPVLPTEKGTTIYGGRDQPRTMFRIANVERHWVDEHGERYTDDEARDLMGEWEETPPSVPERPQITAEGFIQAADTLSGPGPDDAYLRALHAALFGGGDRD